MRAIREGPATIGKKRQGEETMSFNETLSHEAMSGIEADAAQERFRELQGRLLAHYGVQAESYYLELARPRMRAHLLEAGEGEPTIILHGGDGEAVTWAPLLGPLQKETRVLAVDRPGCGLSDPFDYREVDLRAHAAEFVLSLLDALRLDSATLVGGSMGGFFALAAALAHPERVRSLVLVGFALGTTRDLSQGLKTLCGTPGAAEAFMRGRDNLEAQKSQYREMFHVDPRTLPDLYFETRVAGLRLPSERGTWATLLPRVGDLQGTRPEIYLGDELSRLRPPTLILWGEHDMAPIEVARQVAAAIPDARLEALPGVGHFPFLEVPEVTARLISDFVRGRAPSGAGR